MTRVYRNRIKAVPQSPGPARGAARPFLQPGSGEWPEPVLATSPSCLSMESQSPDPSQQHLHPLLSCLHLPRCSGGQIFPIPLSKVLPFLAGLSGQQQWLQLQCLPPQLWCLQPPNSSGCGCSTPHTHTKHQLGRKEVLALGAGLESSKKKQNKAVVLRKVKPTPFLHKYHQGRGG